MRNDFRTFTYDINCNSPEKLRDVVQVARDTSELGNSFVAATRSFPNGIEETITQRHILGNYFDGIEVGDATATSFKMTFHLREDADRYWKDLIALILRRIIDAGASIKSLTKSA